VRKVSQRKVLSIKQTNATTMKDPHSSHPEAVCSKCNKSMCISCNEIGRVFQLFVNYTLCKDCYEILVFREKAEQFRSLESIYGRGPNAKSCPLYTRFMRNPNDLSTYELEELLNSDILGISDIIKCAQKK
jgi:hypothetical protein